MSEKLTQLMATATTVEKAELVTLNNAVVDCMKAYQSAPTATNKRDWDAAREGLAECVERLTAQYFPASAPAAGLTFKTKSHAFEWYKTQGGRLEKSAFYAKIPAAGRTVERYHVSEMLRQERPAPATGEDLQQGDLERRKLLADTRISEAKAQREELAARKEDKNWTARETVFEREGALIGQTLNETRYQLGRAVPALILAAKGDPARAPEVKKLLEETLFDAYRALYESGEVDMSFLGDDDE